MSPGGSYEDKMNSAPAATANGTGGGGGITMSDVSRRKSSGCSAPLFAFPFRAVCPTSKDGCDSMVTSVDYNR